MEKPVKIEKIVPLIGNIFLPTFMFACALFGFYIQETFSPLTTSVLHIGFYALNCIGFLTLLYFNRGRPVFIFLLLTLTYITVNYLKHVHDGEYIESAAYISLCTLVPINMLILYFLPPQLFFAKSNVWILLCVFAQYSLVELLSRHGIALGWFYGSISPLNTLAFAAFGLLMLITLINAVNSGSIADYNSFFAAICLCMAFYYSGTASGLSVFYFTASLIMLIAIVQIIYTETYKDTLTGLDSRNSYMIHSKNFPLKYSIGVISIDDYDKLGINFGRRIQNTLTRLIANQISELEKDENIYRYNADEFVIVYKNLDCNEGYNRLETIRRAIASAQFEFSSRHRPLKLTVSAGVSEKKRRDANSFEVLVRAVKSLQKTRAFTHNVTSKA